MANIVEPNENSTAEQIHAYADQIAKEAQTDRAGEEGTTEPKDDARITAEHVDNEQKETPAELPSGSDDTADQGEETGESKGQDWLDDDLKAEATAYGISETDLADFASRDELERALRLFDTSAMEAGRKALAEKEGPARDEKGQFTPKEEPKPEPPKEGRYEFKQDLYDEDLEGDLKGYRDYVDARLSEYESRMEAFESYMYEAETRAKERHFDQLVDSLGHADLFGTTDKETDKERQRREDLFVEAETYLKGREALGRPTELNKALLNRIARSLFTDEFGKKDLKQRTRKITKQHNGRQGGGATRPQDPREDPRDEFDRLYRQLEGRT